MPSPRPPRRPPPPPPSSPATPQEQSREPQLPTQAQGGMAGFMATEVMMADCDDHYLPVLLMMDCLYFSAETMLPHWLQKAMPAAASMEARAVP